MVSSALAKARMRKYLNQKQLAELVDMHPMTLSIIERGRQMPRVDTALKLARALDSTVEELFGEQ